MKKLSILLLLFLNVVLNVNFYASEPDKVYLKYEVDLINYQDDLFHVKLFPGKLTSDNQYYNFVAYAPGVHSVLNFGRFVKSFEAFDKNGDEIQTEKVSMNKWRIFEPEKVYRIEYDIEDSFDSDIEEDRVYPMAGTGIEDDYIVLNTFGVIGYFDKLKSIPTQLKLRYNSDWNIGTALNKSDDGYYYANSYHHLTDSPIFIGNLSRAATKIGDIDVEVYVFSKSEIINADTILTLAEGVLNAAKEFVNFTPVNRYSFLMYFIDQEARQRNGIRGGGALEHSYSSTYSLQDHPMVLTVLDDIMAHEFMHILTPLNLRSEIIADFNYAEPSSSDLHLWLYEGVTEWTSDIMQLRNGMITIDEYMGEVSEKINNTERFNPDFSLARISREWHTQEGRTQFGNIYQLGALTAAMLDIRLLELSGGKKGLRELYLELIKKYGKDKPFDNESFFDVIVKMSYPEIREFIDNHINGNKPLPYEDYYSKLGLKYFESAPSENKTPMFGLNLGSPDGVHLSVAGFSKTHKPFGLQEGDIIIKILGEEITIENSDEIFAKRNEMKPGDEYEITILRDDEELTFIGTLLERMDYHIFKVDKNCSVQQKKLRDAWSKNLDL